LGWPAERTVIPGTDIATFAPKVWEPSSQPEFPWIVIPDLKGREGVAIEWVPIMVLAFRTEGVPHGGQLGVFATQAGSPMPLKELAASSAFWDLGKGKLKSLCTEFGLSPPPACSLFVLLQLLVKHCLPGASEQEVLEIMSKRHYQEEKAAFQVPADDCLELVDDKDKKGFEDDLEKEKQEAAERESFRTSPKALREKVKVATSSSSSSQATGSRKKARLDPVASVSWLSSWRGPVLFEPSTLAAGSMTESEAQQMCPPMCKVFMDAYNARWRVNMPGVGSKSRSWGMYGHTKALELVLIWAWQQALDREGADYCHCPGAGLDLSTKVD